MVFKNCHLNIKREVLLSQITVLSSPDHSGHVKFKMFKIFVLTSLTCVLALPTAENIDLRTPYSLKKDCGNGILKVPCLKIAAITLLEKINKKSELTLFPGITLVKDSERNTENSVAVELARSSEEKLDKYLMYQLGAFLETHSVKLSLIDETAVEEVKNVFEARSQKKKNGWAVILAMAAMMKGTNFINYLR